MTKHARFHRLLAGSVLPLFLLLLAGSGILGCGADRSPVASDQQATVPEPGGKTFLAFSPQAAQRAAKTAVTPEDGLTVTKQIGPKGGWLEVKDKGGRGVEDDLAVALRVPPEALAERKKITMTVTGNRLSELVAAFEPSGLKFARSAILTFGLGSARIDMPLENLVVYHVDSDGNVSVARIISIQKFDNRDRGDDDYGDEDGSYYLINIEVPGFSYYHGANDTDDP